jgi:hypothetical protein
MGKSKPALASNILMDTRGGVGDNKKVPVVRKLIDLRKLLGYK